MVVGLKHADINLTEIQWVYCFGDKTKIQIFQKWNLKIPKIWLIDKCSKVLSPEYWVPRANNAEELKVRQSRAALLMQYLMQKESHQKVTIYFF